MAVVETEGNDFNVKVTSYNIYAGLGGSFGGCNYLFTTLCENQEEAEKIAYEEAYLMYESYEGCHGLEDFGDAINEARDNNPDLCDLDDDDNELQSIAQEIYSEYVDNWADYKVILTDEDDIDEEDLILDYYIDNDSSEASCKE